MIKIENVSVYGFEEAIRGMRNPMNSWDKSDSCMEYVAPIWQTYRSKEQWKEWCFEDDE